MKTTQDNPNDKMDKIYYQSHQRWTNQKNKNIPTTMKNSPLTPQALVSSSQTLHWESCPPALPMCVTSLEMHQSQALEGLVGSWCVMRLKAIIDVVVMFYFIILRVRTIK